MEWSGVGEGKGERKWEGGEVGSYYGRREGGGWEDGLGARMWGSGLSGVFRKEGRKGMWWWFKYRGEREVGGGGNSY